MSWHFGPFRLDQANACLWRADQPVALRPKTFALLAYLVTHAGQLVTKEALLDAVWPETAVGDGALKTSMGELRKALGETAKAPRWIATVHGRGYRFVAPVVEHAVAISRPPGAPSLATSDPPHPHEVVPSTPVLPPPEAERRHLTVLFCDLVGSTALTGRLDPEEYREVVHVYHQICADVMQRFDGYVAQYLGDGVLSYFGYPVAHEDDARRAVRAGLDLLDACAALSTHPVLSPGEQVAVRLGVHTGLVVVGDVGAGTRHEPLALGETPNIAARLQHLAEPNTLVISAATHQLIAGYFRCKALGAHTLPGLGQPIEVYRVLGASGAQSRLEVAATHGLTPLVGRAQEVEFLRTCWTRVTEGMGQVVVLGGEAGIGKSRLVQVLKEHVAGTGHPWLECQGSPYYQHTALYPLTELLARRLLRLEHEATAAQQVQNLEEFLGQYGFSPAATMPLFAPLLALPLPAPYVPVQVSPEQQRQQTLHALLDLLLRLAAEQPLLLVMEDLHWVDPSTLEWLNLLVDQGPTTRIMALCTCRPDFTPPWAGRSHCTQVTLTRLPQRQAITLMHQVAHGKVLPTEVVAQVVARTDGVPLFVEEVTKTVLESGLLQEQEDHYVLTGPLPPLAIPATLHDSLRARLDRMGAAKGLAQLGATLGREFAYELLQAVAPWDEETLRQELQQLVRAELLHQRGLPPQATYVFKHALIQEAAYQSLLKRTRQQFHQRVAQVLSERFPDTITTQPEVLAQHYTAAGLLAPAVDAWQRAGQRAAERSAHAEAISHLTKGLEVLATLPDTHTRAHHELQFHCILGTSLIATRGFAATAVEQTYARARELCRQLQDTQQLFQVLVGLWGFYDVRDHLPQARDMGEQLLALAHSQHDPALLVLAHRMLGETFLWLGELGTARAHLEHGIALYDPQQHRAHGLRYGHDAGTSCLSFLGRVLWHLGYPDQALQRSREALTLAQELGHLFSLAFTLRQTISVHQLRGEADEVLARTQRVLTLATEHGFAQIVATGMRDRGWALTMQGHMAEGIALMHQGYAAYRATGAERAYHLAWLAEALGKASQVDEGLHILAEGLALVEQHEERVYEAELHRLKGTLLLQQATPDAAQAEACFQQALAVARRQQAKSLELRAATSLSRLWQQQGKRDEARVLLAEVYGWFTEGFDTVDLQDARALLEALA